MLHDMYSNAHASKVKMSLFVQNKCACKYCVIARFWYCGVLAARDLYSSCKKHKAVLALTCRLPFNHDCTNYICFFIWWNNEHVQTIPQCLSGRKIIISTRHLPRNDRMKLKNLGTQYSD